MGRDRRVHGLELAAGQSPAVDSRLRRGDRLERSFRRRQAIREPNLQHPHQGDSHAAKADLHDFARWQDSANPRFRKDEARRHGLRRNRGQERGRMGPRRVLHLEDGRRHRRARAGTRRRGDGEADVSCRPLGRSGSDAVLLPRRLQPFGEPVHLLRQGRQARCSHSHRGVFDQPGRRGYSIPIQVAEPPFLDRRRDDHGQRLARAAGRVRRSSWVLRIQGRRFRRAKGDALRGAERTYHSV